MRKIFSISFIYFLIFSFDIFAQKLRSTSFDDRPICEESKGVWRQFSNGCIDECRAKLDKFAICTQLLSYACDCGKNRCWDGDQCVNLQDYKKIFDEEQAEEKKILDEAKEKRKLAAKANAEIIITKLTAPTLGDQSQAKKNQEKKNSEIPQSPITQILPTQTNQVTAEAKVPPLFLQQEQAKQAKSDSTSGASTPPGLPVIPLPN